MTQQYLIGLHNNIRYHQPDLNLKELAITMQNNNIFAVRIGNKSFQKQTVQLIAKVDVADETDKNVTINLNHELVHLKVDDVDQFLTELTESLNKQQYVLVNDDLLFHRNLFLYAEPKVAKTE